MRRTRHAPIEMGGHEMLKFLITSLALALLGTAFVTVEARADFRPCIKAPKDNLPCPMTAQRPQLPKTRIR
jgi:hypothetical protein